MNSKAYRFILTAFCAFVSCQKENAVGPLDYLRFVRNPDNGYIKYYSNTNDNLSITAFYNPPLYVLLNKSKNINKLQSIDKKTNFYQFLLTFTTKDNEPIKNHLQNLLNPNLAQEGGAYEQSANAYLDFGMQPHLKLAIAGDTLPCAFYHAQATGQVDNTYQIIAIFENYRTINKHYDLSLIIDKLPWIEHSINFVFQKKSIEITPDLKL